MVGIRHIRIDSFTIALLVTVCTATILPCSGMAATMFGALTRIAIILLFFMHGAKLSREAVLRGLSSWKLHLIVLACTFLLFPALGFVAATLPPTLVDPSIAKGLVFLSILPSTVQSSIAFTAIAGGNVAAAVCSASLSNILGVFITPLWAGVLIADDAHGSMDVAAAIVDIGATLLLPFILGHLSRRWTAKFVDRRKPLLGQLDRGSILLVVYTAFSAAVIEGLWTRLSAGDLMVILLIDAILLATIMIATRIAARLAGLNRSDEIALVFCGSKKSLASGVPMAAALFPVAQVGPIILPLMVFHQMQLIVCGVLAQSYAARPNTDTDTVAQVA